MVLGVSFCGSSFFFSFQRPRCVLKHSINLGGLFLTFPQALTLEELDQVFSVSTRKHMSYHIKNAVWHFRVWVLRQKLEPMPPFYRQAEKLNEA